MQKNNLDQTDLPLDLGGDTYCLMNFPSMPFEAFVVVLVDRLSAVLLVLLMLVVGVAIVAIVAIVVATYFELPRWWHHNQCM